MILIDIVEDDVIPCDGGKIIYENHQFGFRLYLNKVKQVKGKGVADADDLVKVNGYHEQIMEVLMNDNWRSWESEQIRQLVRQKRQTQGLGFKENNWMRPISELRRKGILIPVKDTKPPRYEIDKEKAKECMETKVFL